MPSKGFRDYHVSAEPYETDEGWIPKAVVTIYSSDESVLLEGEYEFSDYDDSVRESYSLAKSYME